MKRQSTVAKLSRTLCKRLIAFCDEFNCGVIVRFSGVEQGLTADELNELLAAMVSTGLEIVPCIIREGWQSQWVWHEPAGQLAWEVKHVGASFESCSEWGKVHGIKRNGIPLGEAYLAPMGILPELESVEQWVEKFNHSNRPFDIG